MELLFTLTICSHYQRRTLKRFQGASVSLLTKGNMSLRSLWTHNSRPERAKEKNSRKGEGKPCLYPTIMFALLKKTRLSFTK